MFCRQFNKFFHCKRATCIYEETDIHAYMFCQLYMESVQDLLAPEKINIPIVEDPKTGEVSAPGASIVGIQNLDQFLQVLKVGETNRHAANTKMNTESSRSHAILMVQFLSISNFLCLPPLFRSCNKL